MAKSPATGYLERHWFAIGGICLLPFLLFYLFVSGGPPDSTRSLIPLAMKALPDADGLTGEFSRDGEAVLLEGDGRVVRTELSFRLPRREPESPSWVVWMRRAPLERVQLFAGDQWRSGERGFMTPSIEDGVLPVGYLFRLPSTWEGDIVLRMDASSLRSTALRPQIVTEAEAMDALQSATMITIAAYTSLFTLGLLALALYFAARDLTFLSFFGFCIVGVLQIAVYNGHLYQFDGLGLLARLGGGVFGAMSLIFEASILRILLRYTDMPTSRPKWTQRVNVFVVALLFAAGGLIVWAQNGGRLPVWSFQAIWLTGVLVGLAMLLDAWRRRITMALAVFCVALVAASTIAISELTAVGMIAGTWLSHYGFLIATVVCALMLAVGLISRISKYREQRDREQRAREESERKLYREAVRSELLAALQMGLRGLEEEDIQETAFRLLLDHLHRIVPANVSLTMTRGHLGRDTLVSRPAAVLDRMPEHELQRLHNLRHQLSGVVELQYPVTKAGEEVPVAMEAAVTMPIRAPAWGALVLERNGATAFHPDELVIARELARIAVVQIGEALAALKLRHTAEVDALTGSMNRRSIDQSLTRTFQHAHRTGLPVSVLFVDIDHFKTFNDMLGHACGDYCLRELARVLKATLGADDFLGRYGGEEFVVILPGRPPEMARAVAEELRVAVEAAEFVWNERSLRLTVSIGVASRLDGEAVPQPALERADRALYAAKRAGRNRVQVAPAVFKPLSTTARP
jgi:diguanylate cyclase (GGDEF)-like protein